MPKLRVGQVSVLKKDVVYEQNRLKKGSSFEIVGIRIGVYAVKSYNWTKGGHGCSGMDGTRNSWWVPFYMIDEAVTSPIKNISIYEEINL